jgi:hypothetical protein
MNGIYLFQTNDVTSKTLVLICTRNQDELVITTGEERTPFSMARVIFGGFRKSCGKLIKLRVLDGT